MINTLSKKQMNVTGVSNAADAVKNVSGANVQGGKYVFVRGLSDRYSLATLNGVALKFNQWKPRQCNQRINGIDKHTILKSTDYLETFRRNG